MSKTKTEAASEDVSTWMIMAAASFAAGEWATVAMKGLEETTPLVGGLSGMAGCLALWLAVRSAVKSALKGE